jgi:UV DNA damage endonuclease
VRIGYPGRNLALDLPAPPTLRPETYNAERFARIVAANLDAIATTLRWNLEHGVLYWRLNPYTIPLPGHPVVDVDWGAMFTGRLSETGTLVREHALRLTVHPGQYIRLTSPEPEVVRRSVAELAHHATLFDLMGLDGTHKIQVHTGVPGDDKVAAIDRFVTAWHDLPETVRARLAIENDERLFSLADNLAIHVRTGIPLVFDTFHHNLFNEGESLDEALELAVSTWYGHGPAMLDYSTQDPAKQPGAHAATIDPADFARILPDLLPYDPDVMLEIKDKEASALTALAILRTHR